jgi:hypothetical protein
MSKMTYILEPVEIEFLQELADARQEVHKGHPKSTHFNTESEFVGCAGEYAFARIFGEDMDTSITPKGDGKVDFETHWGITVDIKTFKKPYNLIVEASEIDGGADIYVLAGYYDENNSVTLIGWDYRNRMRTQPIKDFGYGKDNHYRKASSLQPMEMLAGVLGLV